jgi:SAM-dependent methyltransferase
LNLPQKVNANATFAREVLDCSVFTHDHDFESSPATKRLRSIVWNVYYKYFRPCDSLIDLTCGTGTDAIELASNGIYVLAIDSSTEMIAVLKKKIASTALHPFVTPMQLSFQKLRLLNGQQFDGAYSNFGGLNSTGRLEQVARDLAHLVKPGKHVVLSIMPPMCLWETFSFLIRGKWNHAFRRREPDGVLANVNGERIWVRYFAPNYVRHVFGPHFEFVELRGLNVFSPPPASQTAYRILSKANILLEKLDDLIPKNSRLNWYGDQYLIVFRRKG